MTRNENLVSPEKAELRFGSPALTSPFPSVTRQHCPASGGFAGGFRTAAFFTLYSGLSTESLLSRPTPSHLTVGTTRNFPNSRHKTRVDRGLLHFIDFRFPVPFHRKADAPLRTFGHSDLVVPSSLVRRSRDCPLARLFHFIPPKRPVIPLRSYPS